MNDMSLLQTTDVLERGARLEIEAGAAAVDITPKRQVFIAGYGQNRLSRGIHDPIWARCLFLRIGEETVAFLSLDLIGLFLDDVDVIRNRAAGNDLRPRDIIVSCTHNHEGPDTLGLWGPSIGQSGIDPDYLDQLVEGAVSCISEARESSVSAHLEVGSTSATGVSRNARDPGVLDPTLVSLRASAENGETIATLVNFANHPESLGSENVLISSDWPGYLYRSVERAIGGTCVFQNAALGGMVTPDVTAHTFEEAERIGSATGSATIAALRSATQLAPSHIDHRMVEAEIPVTNQRFLSLAQLKTLKREFRNGVVRTEIHMIRLGDLWMVTVPGEALPKLGLQIKALMGGAFKALIGLGNDELGYIIPEEDFDPSRYEESMSLGPKTAPSILSAVRQLTE